jgi:hypothetical protein
MEFYTYVKWLFALGPYFAQNLDFQDCITDMAGPSVLQWGQLNLSF